MAQQTYTPGPWEIGLFNGVVVARIDVAPDPEGRITGHYDEKYYGGYLIAESILHEADARLVAAAPELLECLKEAIEDAELETNNIPKKWLDLVARIEGK